MSVPAVGCHAAVTRAASDLTPASRTPRAGQAGSGPALFLEFSVIVSLTVHGTQARHAAWSRRRSSHVYEHRWEATGAQDLALPGAARATGGEEEDPRVLGWAPRTRGRHDGRMASLQPRH